MSALPCLQPMNIAVGDASSDLRDLAHTRIREREREHEGCSLSRARERWPIQIDGIVARTLKCRRRPEFTRRSQASTIPGDLLGTASCKHGSRSDLGP